MIAEGDGKDLRFKLGAVELEFQVEVSGGVKGEVSAEGGIQIGVISIGKLSGKGEGERSRSNTHPSAWLSAEMVWHNQALDLALLKWTGHYNATVVTPNLKSLYLSQEHQCRAYGFPRYNAIADGQGFDVDVLVGTIKPIESPKSLGQLRILNDGEVPQSMDDWKGFSGGPVFVADELVGVIIKGPESLQGQRLEAIALAYLKELRELASMVCGVDLEQLAGAQTRAKGAPKTQKTLKSGEGCLLIKV